MKLRLLTLFLAFFTLSAAANTATNGRHFATLVAFSAASGSALWAKNITGIYTSAQHLITDGYSIWATGNGSDSNFIRFDTVSIPTTAGVYMCLVLRRCMWLLNQTW